MPAMCTKFPSAFGEVTDKLIEFYRERARYNVGLIIVENTCVDWPVCKVGENPLRLDDDKFIRGSAELADIVHEYDCKIATQPQHAGGQTNLQNTEGQPVVAPSSVPCPETGSGIPRELAVAEISQIIEKFAHAARRTKQAGFDAVELQGAHGYPVTQFMSPFTNRRTDLYGGTLENRMRFPRAVSERYLRRRENDKK